jgi:general secretion pathway protein D
LQELGIIYPNQLAVIGASTGLTLEALRNVKSPNIGLRPNPSLNFNKTTGDVNLLSNPRIRVKNNEKAKVLVGDKVPIINTTATANGVVAENVTYVDVGLKLDVEPRINLDNYVNIKVGLEVSSLGEKTTTKAGGEAYTIGTRNANTVLRLKHGETQILAGLILDDERKSTARLPGLGDIPVLGRLFSNQSDKKSKTEIVLAITPRILSNIQLPKADIAEYWTGTESLILDHPRISIPTSNSGAKSSISSSPSTSLGDQTDTPPTSVDAKESNLQAPSSNLNNPAQANGNAANKSPTQESPISNTQSNINPPEPSSNAAASSSGGNQNQDVVEMIKRSKEIIESHRLNNAADPNAQ